MLDLTATEKHAIRLSWARVSAAPATAARLFYGRLFDVYPETRALFPADMRAQGEKLIATINALVDHLDSDFSQTAETLGATHRDLGIDRDDYEKVRAALLWMMEAMTTGAFTDDVGAAWSRAYDQLARAMYAPIGMD